jgi:hypothetical protein
MVTLLNKTCVYRSSIIRFSRAHLNLAPVPRASNPIPIKIKLNLENGCTYGLHPGDLVKQGDRRLNSHLTFQLCSWHILFSGHCVNCVIKWDVSSTILFKGTRTLRLATPTRLAIPQAGGLLASMTQSLTYFNKRSLILL